MEGGRDSVAALLRKGASSPSPFLSFSCHPGRRWEGRKGKKNKTKRISLLCRAREKETKKLLWHQLMQVLVLKFDEAVAGREINDTVCHSRAMSFDTW